MTKKPTLEGLRITKPYMSAYGNLIRRVENKSGTTLFVFLDTWEGCQRNVQRIIDELDSCRLVEADIVPRAPQGASGAESSRRMRVQTERVTSRPRHSQKAKRG